MQRIMSYKKNYEEHPMCIERRDYCRMLAFHRVICMSQGRVVAKSNMRVHLNARQPQLLYVSRGLMKGFWLLMLPRIFNKSIITLMIENHFQ